MDTQEIKPKPTPNTYINIDKVEEPLYSLQEICSIFNYSYGRFYSLRMRYAILCVLLDGTKHFPQRLVDEAMQAEEIRLGNDLADDWYSCFDLMKLYGLGKTQIRRFALTHDVRTKRIHGNRLYYLKADWEAARRKAERESNSTKMKR